MASTLPTNPSLDKLRVEAREFQRANGVALHAAQLAVARRYGFTGWPALVHYLRLAADLSADPGAVDEGALDPADRFCSWASLRYDESDAPPRWRAAADLLAADPGLVDRSIWCAAAASDPVALADHLARRPALANTGGGPFGWVPMMYLCYSRVPLGRSVNDALAAAALLLDAGADPNGGYLWCGMSTPFTLLTGVFGEGEQGPRRQPRHPHATQLATLLLRRGAHPVDQQTLYNRMFRPDDSHLELLFAHGLADAGPSPWERRLGEAMETREQLWQRQVQWAAAHGFSARLALLERHGIDVSGAELVTPAFPDDPNVRDDQGATPLHQAAWEGDVPLIRRLLEAGADPSITDDRFGSTPLEWAEHAYQTEAAELLRATSGPPAP
jgi:ankyrin repeat protein